MDSVLGLRERKPEEADSIREERAWRNQEEFSWSAATQTKTPKSHSVFACHSSHRIYVVTCLLLTQLPLLRKQFPTHTSRGVNSLDFFYRELLHVQDSLRVTPHLL